MLRLGILRVRVYCVNRKGERTCVRVCVCVCAGVCVCVCVRVLIFNAVFDFCQGPKLQGLEGKSLGPGHPQSAVLESKHLPIILTLNPNPKP